MGEPGAEPGLRRRWRLTGGPWGGGIRVVTHAALCSCRRGLPGSGRVASQWRGHSGEGCYLELPLVELHPPQPDLVLLEVAGDVGR